MWDFNVLLLSLTRQSPEEAQALAGLDASADRSPAEKAVTLSSAAVVTISQKGQLGNPDGALSFAKASTLPLLSSYAEGLVGIQTADDPKYTFCYWEVCELDKEVWDWIQSTPDDCSTTAMQAGLCWILRWEGGVGSLVDLPNSCIRALHALGKKGVMLARMAQIRAYCYEGTLIHQNAAFLLPRDPSHLPAIWCFCSSPDYNKAVRAIDQKLNVTNATLVKVPFDLAHWQRVSAEKYPNGLPKPQSNDPTQWLFNGHPKGSDHPLHVAVARLLGYQWPRQTGSSFPDCPAIGPDGLEKLADKDGIVCLPPLNREQPAAQRLRALLSAALGDYNERDLIRKSGPKGSSKTSLEEWLRDDFFAHHCAIFHSRPFIWHIWDGLKDGFHALVNYHKLDHDKLKALAYTYLGDWIRDQKAAAEADTPGAAERLGAAKELQVKLIAILEGEAPLDIFIRWKPLHKQPIGWHPDLNDGVRQNIRPFLLAGDVGAKGAGLFRSKPGIDPEGKPDRGTEPHRDKADYPWFWCEDEPGTDPSGGKEFTGRRWNTAHFTRQAKRDARKNK
jgi:hypothetical protein